MGVGVGECASNKLQMHRHTVIIMIMLNDDAYYKNDTNVVFLL